MTIMLIHSQVDPPFRPPGGSTTEPVVYCCWFKFKKGRFPFDRILTSMHPDRQTRSILKRERASILSPGYDKFEKICRLVRQGQDDTHDAAVAEVTSMESYEGWLIRNLGLDFGSFRFGRDISHEVYAISSRNVLHLSLIVSIQPFCNKCGNSIA